MKIGIICVGWAFLQDLLKELKIHHLVSILKPPFSAKRVESFMRGLDVLYIEWCASYMATITHVPKHCKIVNRLHRHEVHGRWMKKVDFTKIDLLILVNNFMKGYCFKYQPNLRKVNKIQVIQQGVNIDKFTYKAFKDFKDWPLRGYGKRIGWIGYVKPVKNPVPVLRLMSELPDWQLKLLGIPSLYPKLTMQVQKLAKRRNIVWIKKPIPHEKMPNYYRKLDLLVNTSVTESQCFCILEAMSSGVYPLIRNWPHAEELYLKENLFQSMLECKHKILNWVKKSHNEKKQLSKKMRIFIKKRYNVEKSVRKMREAIENV